jgi:hypothetical protein
MAFGREACLRRLPYPPNPFYISQILAPPQPAQAGFAARSANQARLQPPAPHASERMHAPPPRPIVYLTMSLYSFSAQVTASFGLSSPVAALANMLTRTNLLTASAT